MIRLMILLAGLRGLLTSRPDFQNSFLQIILPEKVQANTSESDNSEVENEQVSYSISIDEKPYTVHLKQRFFLANNFMVYMYNQGSVNSQSSNIQPESTVSTDLIPLYLEMHIVVDKALFDYLGSDSMIVTNKIIEIIGLVNSMFAQLKISIVLSSLELWSDKNKISTVGEAEELLHRFLEWKNSYLTLRPHDIAYLFIFREYPDYVGAAFPGKMCVTGYSAGVALFPKEMTLEAVSVIVTQMLGLSLGISYDDPKKCRCSGAICIMSTKAVQSSGMKTFSDCSLRDFEHFISNVGAQCLQNKPQMQANPAAICGNGRVEGNEACDCGSEEECGPDNCCDPRTCVLKPDKECSEGSCCNDCEICVNRQCADVGPYINRVNQCSAKCSGNGVCTSQMICNCTEGYVPPNCTTRARISPGEQGLLTKRTSEKGGKKQWLLAIYVALPVLIVATVIVASWKLSKKWFSKKEESQSSGSTSESSSQSDTVRSKSESSPQTNRSSN